MDVWVAAHELPETFDESIQECVRRRNPVECLGPVSMQALAPVQGHKKVGDKQTVAMLWGVRTSTVVLVALCADLYMILARVAQTRHCCPHVKSPANPCPCVLMNASMVSKMVSHR